jgi:hypothetical protein
LSRAKLTIIAVSLAALSLGGCDSLRRAAGVDKAPPDEFSVVSRAPLELPPDYTLRPPRAGALRPQEVAPTDQARQTVFRAAEKNPPIVANGTHSAGEVAILQQAGATAAPPDIRKTVNQENTKLSDPDRSFIDSLLFWKSEPVPGDIINPQKEAQRLQGNAAAGKKPDDGDAEAATIERKPTGWFSKIF